MNECIMTKLIIIVKTTKTHIIDKDQRHLSKNEYNQKINRKRVYFKNAAVLKVHICAT